MKPFTIFALILCCTAFTSYAQKIVADSISVYFASNSCTIATAEKEILQHWLSLRVGNKTFIVTGYADNRSSAQYNLQLSHCRADAVVTYVKTVSDLIDIKMAAYGESLPASQTLLHLNRRVVITVS